MKHSAPPAKPSALGAVLIVGLALFTAACATATRTAPSAVHLPFAAPKVNAININTASSWELETLPGIGKAIAERIIAHRERYGPFRRAEHLLLVRGISDRKFRALRPMITVN